MPDDRPADEDAAEASARRRGRRYGAQAVIVIAVIFIGSSAAQVVPAVFGFGVRPLPSAPPGSSARTCAEGVRALAQDTVQDTGDSPPNRESPVYRACAASPEGLDAWAALLRLRRAAAELPHGNPPELGPLRRDLSAHLPAELR
jgi:hypothetical protein